MTLQAAPGGLALRQAGAAENPAPGAATPDHSA
jgi:hypothetical protein